MAADGEILAMVKPQFELGPERVGKGGVVREAADRRDALRSVGEAAEHAELGVLGFASSGLPGPKGNRETFIRLSKDRGATPGVDIEAAVEAVEP
jgi:23S rRNA (cytidine1920-2'-O)/16S rRNA (cytidine1409-2'-O)-methyltransferase